MIMVSCKDTERVLTSATGTIYECLVVMNNESLTQEELEAVAKKSSEEEYSAFSQDISTTYGLVETIMGAEMPCMPQPESYFKLTHVTMSMFDNVLKPTRNILIVDINPKKYTKVTTKVNSDVWSTPQAVCHIQAPSQQEFVNYWLEKENGFVTGLLTKNYLVKAVSIAVDIIKMLEIFYKNKNMTCSFLMTTWSSKTLS
jgi:hypothetical protein